MWIYVLGAIFVVVSIVLRLPTVKGWFGEQGVALRLRKLDPNQYKVLHDITVPTTNGKTTQIDHVVISKYGLFIIETKNYNGWIVGEEHKEYWMQVIYKRKERLYNPLRQNYAHTKAILGIIGEQYEQQIIPVVCFSNRATLKVKVEKSNVIYSSQILSVIQNYQHIVLTDDDLRYILLTITQRKITEKGTKKAHVESIQNSLIDKELSVANNICPKCNGVLVVRFGKHGKFKGCKNYPTCKFTYKLIDG